MTLQPLGFDFPIMSPMSKRPPHAVDHEEQLAEVRRELADRRGLYAKMVRDGKMTAEDADRHILILAAIADDLATFCNGAEGRRCSWDAKVRELRRELALRRNIWPKRVARPTDPLDESAAARRMEALEAVHFRYWMALFGSDSEFENCEARFGIRVLIRAYIWRVWNFEREAAQRGEPWVRPGMAELFASIDAGDASSRFYWSELEDAARKHGFLQAEGLAA